MYVVPPRWYRVSPAAPRGTLMGMNAVHTLDNSESLAEVLSVSPETVRRLARDAKLPCIRVGSQWRFDRAEVLAALGLVAKEDR